MKKILIVEDDNVLSIAINTAIQAAGYETALARDGLEALSKVKKFQPDLILLDLVMPKMTGEEVLAAIRSDENTKDIPVFILTVKTENESVSKCVELGIRGYFIKAHYTLDEIVREVNKVLK